MNDARLQTVASGVHVWIGAGGDSNAGAIESDKGLIVVDAQQSRALGEKFRDAAKAATDAPIRMVINTHFHLDHVAGNVAFADATIVAHDKTRQLMERELGPMPPIGVEVSDTLAKIRMFFGSNFEELVPVPERQWFIDRVGGPKALQILGPTETFQDSMELVALSDKVRLQYFGPAHCDGDVIIHLPTAGVVFMGDLFFHARFPWFGDCDLNGWIAAIDRVLKLDVTVVVPGHGAPATRKELEDFRNLLTAVRDAVDRAIKSGSSEEGAVKDIRLAQYAAMQRYTEWMPYNVRAAYRYLRG